MGEECRWCMGYLRLPVVNRGGGGGTVCSSLFHVLSSGACYRKGCQMLGFGGCSIIWGIHPDKPKT